MTAIACAVALSILGSSTALLVLAAVYAPRLLG